MDSKPCKYRWHDFHRPGWYLITLKAATRGRKIFAINGPEGLVPLPLGLLVEDRWRTMCEESQGLLVADTFQLMADHVHVLLEVKGVLDKPLGSYIGAFKAATTSMARRRLGYPKDAPLWEDGFDWRIKTTARAIEEARRYLRDNPVENLRKREATARFGAPRPICHRRLPFIFPMAVPPSPPISWMAFGNERLLEQELWPVRISRAATLFTWDGLIAEARARSARGIVHISPWISHGEEAVEGKVLEAGGSVVKILSNPFTPYYHPTKVEMDGCVDGRFLAISPFPMGQEQRPLTRGMAEQLNTMAEEIAQTTEW